MMRRNCSDSRVGKLGRRVYNISNISISSLKKQNVNTYHARAQLVKTVDAIQILQYLRRHSLPKPDDSDVAILYIARLLSDSTVVRQEFHLRMRYAP